jgi:hypothetical protein
MRWTRWRRKTSGATRGRQSRVVLTPRRWRQVFAGVIPCASDGGKRARSPGRARNKLLKPLRREGWVFRQTCGDYARMLFQTLHARLRVLAAHPAFPAPSSLLGENVRAQLGRTPRRGMADVCRHCCRGILRDAACRPLLRMRSSQVGMKSPHVAKSAPHGEEAHRAVSNHQASRGERSQTLMVRRRVAPSLTMRLPEGNGSQTLMVRRRVAPSRTMRLPEGNDLPFRPGCLTSEVGVGAPIGLAWARLFFAAHIFSCPAGG